MMPSSVHCILVEMACQVANHNCFPPHTWAIALVITIFSSYRAGNSVEYVCRSGNGSYFR